MKSKGVTWFFSGCKLMATFSLLPFKILPITSLSPGIWCGVVSAISSFTAVCFCWLAALSSYSLMILGLGSGCCWLAACCKAFTALQSNGLWSWTLLINSSASVVTYLEFGCDPSPLPARSKFYLCEFSVISVSNSCKSSGMTAKSSSKNGL